MENHFDSILIGAGQAGPSLAGRLTAAGERIAFVERKLFGGTCVNNGCIPTKTLVASAYAAQMSRRAAEYGVELAGPVRVDMKAVKARKEQVLLQSRNGVEKSLCENKNCTVFHEHARFLSSHEVQVGDAVISADKIFINVGARARVPKLPGVGEIPYLTNSTLLDLDVLPEHLVIIGGSYIGLEFAQVFRRFGSQVTVVEMGPRIIQHEDEDISSAVQQILEKEGVAFRLGAECIAFEKAAGGQIGVHVDCKAGEPKLHGSHVLLAVGRVPNTDDLDLAKAGVETDERGYIRVDDQLRTSAPQIWAMGDCNGKGAFTHTSYNDFEIVAGNLLDKDTRRVSDRIPCYGLYIDPPLGHVGMTEAEVRKSGRPALIGTRPMTKVGRAVEKGESQGFMKVLVDAETKKILGASILGVGGDEAVHCILDVMYAGAPYTTISRAVHIHPTVSELIPTVLQSLKPLE
ncbi:MAG TPA: FAD-containing oxidoreductase [Acidobacteriaceae bacterium]|nr:FAD-containing oxidoreductase [Acidobacteriaceae bacterium]